MTLFEVLFLLLLLLAGGVVAIVVGNWAGALYGVLAGIVVVGILVAVLHMTHPTADDDEPPP